MNRTERWALDLLDQHHAASLGWAAIQPGAPDRSDVLDALTALERAGLAAYDPTTLHWTITIEGRTTAMRRNKKTSRAADTRDNVVGRSGLLGTGTSTGAGADSSSVSAPVTLSERDAFALDMFGPHALMEDAVKGEPVLAERLASAIRDGMPPIDLSGVPRYRRAATIESALDSWTDKTAGGPCEICGVRTARATGYNPWRSSDGPRPVPSFQKGKCQFCREYLAHPHHNLDGLKRRVLMALAGLRSLDWAGNGGVPTYAELREHLPSVRPGEPWAYLRQPGLVEGMLKALDLPRHCYVQNQRESLLWSFDNLTAPIWSPEDLPARKPVPPVYLEPSAKAKRADREWAAFQKARRRSAEEWRKRREATFELVDDGTGPTIDPRRRFLSDADTARPLISRR